jgi:hypothetical protein
MAQFTKHHDRAEFKYRRYHICETNNGFFAKLAANKAIPHEHSNCIPPEAAAGRVTFAPERDRGNDV